MTVSVTVSGWGERIRMARNDLGLSQSALGERLGKTRATIASWEEETTSPAVSEVAAIARALKITPAWLVFGRRAA